jgi:hypothetical protein
MVKSIAEKFIREIAGNSDFRKSFYSLDSLEDKKKYMAESGFAFELYEFEEAINHMKTECAEEEDAILLDELLLWWTMLIPQDEIEYPSAGTACSPEACGSCSSCS